MAKETRSLGTPLGRVMTPLDKVDRCDNTIECPVECSIGITAELTRLDVQIGDLSSCIVELAKKLLPVLKLERPTDFARQEIEDPDSQIAIRIRNAGMSVCDMKSMIVDIIGRVDI